MLRDRVAQTALKLIMEPVFEVDFYPSSYSRTPGPRCHRRDPPLHPQAVDLRMGHRGRHQGFFDNVDHHVLMGLVAEPSKTAR